ncbi:MAG: hypothetical protein AAFQ50_01960, partial [Pseudomonadota bacterium]
TGPTGCRARSVERSLPGCRGSSFGIWGFNLASKSTDADLGPLPDGLRYLTADTFAAARVFSNDLTSKTDIQTNSIFNPTIYRAYARDVRQ